MSLLIKKEIRLLLPAWIGAMILAIIPAWIAGAAWNLDYSPYQTPSGLWLEGVVPLTFALGTLLLGISPFGQEFSQGTFTVLLSQPVKRSYVWRTKIIVVAFAFLAVWLTAVVSIWCQYYWYDRLHLFNDLHPLHYLYFNKNYEYFSVAFHHTAVSLTLSVLVMFSGGLWTTLLLRQINAAFWFTLLAPLAIILGTMSLLSDRIASDQSIGTIIAVALIVYSVAGFFAAAILFRRCQDLQSSGGEVSFSWFKKFAGLETASRTRAIPFRPRHRLIALAWKEIYLHQVNVLIAALILLLQLASFITRKIHPHFSNPDLQAVLETIWILWLLMPILIGCSAIAEERRFGIMESQLTLPVSRRMQLFIKFSIGLIFSLFLGAALPLLVEGAKDLHDWLFLVAGGLFFVSFYASSLARTVLQAIGLAIVVGIVLFFGETITAINIFIGLSQHRYTGYSEPGLDLLKTFLGLPILLLVLIRLIFWNYKQLRQNTSLILVNFSSLLAAFAAIYFLTFGIYFRAWEYVTPTLPLRGFMRLSPATEVKLAGSPGAISAVLPDGRLWIQNHNLFLSSRLGYWDPSVYGVSLKGQAAFVPGTNWVETAADNFQVVGIRSDGSLWSLQKQWSISGSRLWQRGPFSLAQIGSDTNWSQAASSSLGFLLLKNDGSLWTWGTNGFDQWPNKLKSDLSQLPARLGNKTNWMQLYSSDASAYAMNDNGDVWSWLAWVGTNKVSQFYIHDTARGPWLSFMPGWNGDYIGVKTDGALWLRTTRPYLLAEGTKWKAAIFDWNNNIMAIRRDGTLWNCSDFNPVQLDSHSDWIALSPGGLALAADGSLWAWDQPSHYAWLAPSHKPAYMGNIFEAAPASP